MTVIDEAHETLGTEKRGGGSRATLDFGVEGMSCASCVGRVERAVAAVVERWGRLDVLLANAGVNGVWAPIEELTPEEFESTVAINLTGTFYTIKYAVPQLKRQGGSVIVTSSINGTRVFSNTGATAYSATKAAQVAMTKILAVELAKHRIRVNVICPGKIDTEIEESTEHRELERAGVPVEFPEGDIPLTDGRSGSAASCTRSVPPAAATDASPARLNTAT